MDADDCGERFSWAPALSRVDTLTDRELEVFGLLAEGGSNQEIADVLFISERTVRAHLAEIQRKLRLRSRLRACIASYVHVSGTDRHDLVATDNSPWSPAPAV